MDAMLASRVAFASQIDNGNDHERTAAEDRRNSNAVYALVEQHQREIDVIARSVAELGDTLRWLHADYSNELKRMSERIESLESQLAEKRKSRAA